MPGKAPDNGKELAVIRAMEKNAAIAVAATFF